MSILKFMKAWFIIVLLLLHIKVIGQDRIVLRNGTVYKVKITEVTANSVLFLNKDQEPFSVDKSWIDQIRYENVKQVKFYDLKDTLFNKMNSAFFYNEPKVRKQIDTLGSFYQRKDKSMQDYYLKGEADAYLRRNYDGFYRASFLSTLVFPPAGLIVSYCMWMTPPQIKSIYISDESLLKEEAYLYAYKKVSYKQKSIRVLKGFTLGLVTGSTIYYLILK